LAALGSTRQSAHCSDEDRSVAGQCLLDRIGHLARSFDVDAATPPGVGSATGRR
jgi:hypothetical protein